MAICGRVLFVATIAPCRRKRGAHPPSLPDGCCSTACTSCASGCAHHMHCSTTETDGVWRRCAHHACHGRYDACYNRFSPCQVARMRDSFEAFRPRLYAASLAQAAAAASATSSTGYGAAGSAALPTATHAATASVTVAAPGEPGPGTHHPAYPSKHCRAGTKTGMSFVGQIVTVSTFSSRSGRTSVGDTALCAVQCAAKKSCMCVCNGDTVRCRRPACARVGRRLRTCHARVFTR